MQVPARIFSRQLLALSHIWKRQVNPSDFVWLARFRLLIIYIFLKATLMLVLGVIGMRIELWVPHTPFHLALLLPVAAILSISASILLLILGLVLASRQRPRCIGFLMLGTADVCVILAAMFACILGDLLLLLIVLVAISCITPLFIERISRYAKSYEQSKDELASIQHRLDMLLFQYKQEISMAIESERSSLRREIHDRLMQELSAVLLQISMLLMHTSAEGGLQLNAAQTAQLDATLRGVMTEARSIMQDLKSPQPLLEE